MSGDALTLLTAGALAAASELGRRGSLDAVVPPSGCSLLNITEHNYEAVETFIGYDYYAFLDAVDDLFARGEIRMGRDEHPFEACLTADGLLYGASSLAERFDPDSGWPTVRFSVVVDESARRKGVASQLIKSVLAHYPTTQYRVEAWVVNPYMAEILQRRFGFETEGGGDWSEHDPFLVAP